MSSTQESNQTVCDFWHIECCLPNELDCHATKNVHLRIQFMKVFTKSIKRNFDVETGNPCGRFLHAKVAAKFELFLSAFYIKSWIIYTSILHKIANVFLCCLGIVVESFQFDCEFKGISSICKAWSSSFTWKGILLAKKVCNAMQLLFFGTLCCKQCSIRSVIASCNRLRTKIRKRLLVAVYFIAMVQN